MKVPNHDLAPGQLFHCQVCGSANLHPVIDLGHQALSDSLLTPEQLNLPESTYPSRFVVCGDCSLGQIDYVVAHEVAHLRHMNHSAAFWRTVGQLYPDYEAASALLDRNDPLYRTF